MIKKTTIFILTQFIFWEAVVFCQPVTNKKSWLRLDDSVSRLKVSPGGKYVAYVNHYNHSLRLLEVATKKIYQIWKGPVVDELYSWSQDGYRLFYNKKSEKSHATELVAYDCGNHKNVKIQSFLSPISYLSMNHFDNRIFYLHKKGIGSIKLTYPGKVYDDQIEQRNNPGGYWIVSKKHIFWLKKRGVELGQVFEAESNIVGFDINHDSSAISWSTENGKVYISLRGQEPIFIGFGRDVSWHPNKKLIVFAGQRKQANYLEQGFDLRVANIRGEGRWLTSTGSLNERWPQWYSNENKLLYTKENTTDLFVLEVAKM